jgi:hypothetical protein
MCIRAKGKPHSGREGLVLLLALAALAHAQTYISEVLFNPPSSDAPNQYIELRGQPNQVLLPGTYFLVVNGNAADNPGAVSHIFDLSGRAIGGNGYLLLLQRGNSYATTPGATVLVNTNGVGWGTGSTSSIGHRGKSGATDLPHPSVTFFLVQTTNPPAIDDDIDANDNGVPGGPVWTGWRVLDSVGVLSSAGAGDIAYGAINYRRNSSPGDGATASGTIVPVGFTPGYVGRAGNTTGYAATNWVAGDNLLGSAPDWTLSDGPTTPSAYDLEPLDHLGGPNFDAAPLNGVVAVCPDGGLLLNQGGGASSYELGLNTAPAGAVTVQATAESPLQISTNGGAAWGANGAFTFSGTARQTVLVRATNDNQIDVTPQFRLIHHAIARTGDPAKYPASAATPVVSAALIETEPLLLNELKVNPPGTNDTQWEYVEIKGPPNALLTNLYFLSIESDGSKNPGKADLVVNLTSTRLGSSGLLLIGATNNPYQIPAGTTLLGDGHFNKAGSALGHGSRSFLLVSSPDAIVEGDDLDSGNNGILEGLPAGTTLLDSVSFAAGSSKDVFYSSAVLALPASTPDAAARFPTDPTPNSGSAWFYGALSGTEADSAVFDSTELSTNFPAGAVLTPAQPNGIAITISGVGPLSGVIGDPTNPGMTFTVADAHNPGAAVAVRATSSNPSVVPDVNLTLTAGTGGWRTLYLDPTNVGFSTITLLASNSSGLGAISFPYAASAMGPSNGLFHTGASDASAGEVVDGNYMLVGDDENPVVRLYERHRSGAPLREFDFRPYLNVSEQNAGEVDIEGSTRVGNRLYWTGSHAHNNLAENRTNRMRFFATDLVGTSSNAQLVFVGFYEYFKDDVIAWDQANGHGKGSNYYGLAASAADAVNPKAPYGFNIEGLSMAPGSTNAAYMAFRAPIVPPTNRTYALIVPVLNFAALAALGGPKGSCLFGAPIELDLYGRGIRTIEGTTNGYVLVGGNPGDGKNKYPLDFKLYTWTGRPEDQPQQRTADLSGLQPEGLVEAPPLPWTADTQVQLLSDMGSRVIYNDGVQNKHEPYPAFKKSRSDWIALGPAVNPAPIILSSRMTATTLTITWRSLKGLTYAVQHKNRLEEAAWTDAPGDVLAGGPYAAKDLPRGTGFYRVVVR